MDVVFDGGGKFQPWEFPFPFEELDAKFARVAAACACCACIVELPPNRSTFDDLPLEASGGGMASGRGEGGASHRPRAAADSNKLRVRE